MSHRRRLGAASPALTSNRSSVKFVDMQLFSRLFLDCEEVHDSSMSLCSSESFGVPSRLVPVPSEASTATRSRSRTHQSAPYKQLLSSDAGNRA